jgi:hypothetical protein
VRSCLQERLAKLLDGDWTCGEVFVSPETAELFEGNPPRGHIRVVRVVEGGRGAGLLAAQAPGFLVTHPPTATAPG